MSNKIIECYSLSDKICEYHGTVDIEIFHSKYFEKVALINNHEVLLQNLNFILSESISMIPYCTRPISDLPLKVLICGTLNIEIAEVLFRNIKSEVMIDIVLKDINSLEIMQEFFPNCKEILKRYSINVVNSFLNVKYRDYDIIINLDTPSKSEFEAMYKMGKDDCITIFKLENLFLEKDNTLEMLKIASGYGNILMPFWINSYTQHFYAFLSKKYHPLADLCLQKSDMLEDMKFYNSNIHTSVFRMPNIISSTFKSYIKN